MRAAKELMVGRLDPDERNKGAGERLYFRLSADARANP